MLLASDDANKEFVNPKNPDMALKVTFYSRTEPHSFNIALNAEHKLCGDATDCPHLKNADGKEIRGRSFPMPEQVTEDWINISVPGRTDLDLHEPVREDHKKRFPTQWSQYQGHIAQAEQTTGTPLSQWGVLTQHQVTALQAQRFYTVEQIAGCSDGQIQALGMNGPVLRQQARGFVLKGRENTEAAQKEKELQDLKASIPALVAAAAAEAVRQAMATQQLPVVTPPKRKGRPPKQKATDGANAAPVS